jgi:hypothetical protein
MMSAEVWRATATKRLGWQAILWTIIALHTFRRDGGGWWWLIPAACAMLDAWTWYGEKCEAAR